MLDINSYKHIYTCTRSARLARNSPLHTFLIAHVQLLLGEPLKIKVRIAASVVESSSWPSSTTTLHGLMSKKKLRHRKETGSEEVSSACIKHASRGAMGKKEQINELLSARARLWRTWARCIFYLEKEREREIPSAQCRVSARDSRLDICAQSVKLLRSSGLTFFFSFFLFLSAASAILDS